MNIRKGTAAVAILSAFWLLTAQQLHAQTCGSFTGISKGAAGYHTVGIKTDGTLWVWGHNSNGQLGNGTFFQQNTPVQIGTAANWWQTITGGAYTLALKRDSTLWAWGDNTYGQLGDGTLISKNIPVPIAATAKWIAISAGQNYSVAIQANGSLWAWGINNNGQLGDGTFINRSTPTQIGAATDWTTISCGVNHTLAIRAGGSLWAWGDNAGGQLGDGTGTQRNTPVAIAAGSTWQSVAAGQVSSAGIKTGGTLWGWGNNGNGQLGIGNNNAQALPVQAGTASNWKEVSAGGLHCLALKTDGTLWAWGDNGAGQLGDGTTLQRRSPVPIAAAANWSVTGTGASHSAAIRADGALFTWGLNFLGMLGNGTTATATNPSGISNNNTITLATANTMLTLPVVYSTTFFNGVSCNNLVATVTPGGVLPVNGLTTARLWIESTQPQGFVKRHFEMMPVNNAQTATGTITLYCTQQEFDAYNAVHTVKLPANPTDSAGKANVRIEKRNGTSNDNTGFPGSYTGNISFIDPADTAITWNAIQNRWELSFPVTGFGALFVGTSTQLNFNICSASVHTITTGATGTNYQWQFDMGTGFTDIVNDAVYSGATTNSLTITGLSSAAYYGIRYRCLVNGVPDVPYLVSFDVRWQGGISNNWFNPGNWSGCGAVPDSGTMVIVPAGTPNSPALGSSTAIRGIRCQPGASVTIQTGAVLTILK
ncbi:MAG: hypothetical protein JNM68_03250 [Dinghuibacter sp.]|nr:hypothetical protein [Dinghuibacter sp.]